MMKRRKNTPLFFEPKAPLNGPFRSRSFIPGFASGMRLSGGGGGGGTPGFTSTETAFLSADKTILPFLSTASYPHAIYVSGLDKTFIVWERVPSPHESSVAAIISSDHAANAWSTVYDIGTWSNPDDAHGQPTILYGPDSHFYCFFGSHSTTQRWAISTNINDISSWTQQTDLSGLVSYPHPVKIGSQIYLLNRNDTDANRRKLQIRVGTPSVGSLTFGSATDIVDFGADSRVYISEVHPVGNNLHFTATFADAADTTHVHVYYFKLETDGAGTITGISNVDGSVTVLAASFPISLTTANTSFRIVEHTGTDRNVALSSLHFDTSGNAHVIYGSGTPDAQGRVQTYHTYWNGTAWSAAATIVTVEISTYVALVPGLSGAMEAWYHQDSGGAHSAGGSIMCRRTWNGSTWATQETMATAGTYPLDRPFAIRDAHANMRVAWCEMIEPHDYGLADTLKRFTHGDSGYAIGPSPAVLQHAAEAGNDVLHVKVNDGTIYDLTGNYISATTATVSGTEMVFDGTNDYVELNDSAPYTPAGDFTLILESLKFADVSSLQTVIGHQNNGVAGGTAWRVLFSSTGIHFEVDHGSGIVTKSHSWTPVANQAYDIAYERKGSTLYLYIDTLTTGNHVTSFAMASAPRNVAYPLTIGAEYNTGIVGDYRRYLNGRMTRARMIQEALYAA